MRLPRALYVSEPCKWATNWSSRSRATAHSTTYVTLTPCPLIEEFAGRFQIFSGSWQRSIKLQMIKYVLVILIYIYVYLY